MHVHLYEILSGMKQGVKKKKNVKKSKRKKALPEKKGGYLRHQKYALKIFPASLNRSVYFIQFVIKT